LSARRAYSPSLLEGKFLELRLETEFLRSSS
jgi:hypothetical protein